MARIRPPRRGQPIKARTLAQIATVANKRASMRGSRGVVVRETEDGTVIQRKAGALANPWFAAKITGVTGADHSWKKMVPNGAGGLQDSNPLITGTLNARDLSGDSAEVDDIVWMRYSESVSGQRRYLFKLGGSAGTSSFFARITAGDPGVTNKYSFIEQEINGTTDIFQDKVGGITGTLSAKEINALEDVGLSADGTIVRMFIETDTLDATKYRFDQAFGIYNEAGALDITYSGEHSEAAMAGSGWLINNQTTLGVKITMQTGTSYYPLGDATLYKYVRVFRYTSAGNLFSISSETRVTVEVPVNCNPCP